MASWLGGSRLRRPAAMSTAIRSCFATAPPHWPTRRDYSPRPAPSSRALAPEARASVSHRCAWDPRPSVRLYVCTSGRALPPPLLPTTRGYRSQPLRTLSLCEQEHRKKRGRACRGLSASRARPRFSNLVVVALCLENTRQMHPDPATYGRPCNRHQQRASETKSSVHGDPPPARPLQEHQGSVLLPQSGLG